MFQTPGEETGVEGKFPKVAELGNKAPNESLSGLVSRWFGET